MSIVMRVFFFALICLSEVAAFVLRAPANASVSVPANEVNSTLLNASVFAVREQKTYRSKPMLWWHVHKAAGTYMCESAKANDRVVTPNGNCNWNAHDMYPHGGQQYRYSVSCDARLAHFKASGASWGGVEREMWPSDMCFRKFSYGTMLRDPLNLIRSNHNFVNQYRVQFTGGRETSMDWAIQTLKKNHPSSAFPTAGVGVEMTRMFDNFQVRYFSGAWNVPFGGVTRAHLETAKQRLLQFEVLGVVEHLSTDRLWNALGWPARSYAEKNHKSNAGDSRFYDPIPPHHRAWVMKVNALDQELYEFVKGKAN